MLTGEERSSMSIAVLAGGTSSEREVSFSSGANVVEALREAGFGDVQMLDPADPSFINTLCDTGFNAAFIALHGAGGEDGQMQSVLSFLGMPYTGSGPTASAVAADKDLAKLVYARAGIPCPQGVTVCRGEAIDLRKVIEQVGMPCFVKPAVNGSSYGVSCVKDAADLADAIDHALEYGDKALVEQRIEGTEVTVGVYEDGSGVWALPIVEICFEAEDAEFYTLDVKYISPERIHRVPARISPADYAAAQRMACMAHEALGCEGFSRSDFIVSAEGPVILETNTIPGMTYASLYPDALRHTDLTFPEACAGLIERALKRTKG